MVKKFLQSAMDPRIRTGLWALRTRGDMNVLTTVSREIFGVENPVGGVDEHLDAAIGWLCAAQDASPSGGVAAFYDLREGGWGPLYPETTGYIIPTFFDYALHAQDPRYRDRAVRMADWLITLQLGNGAFPIGPLWPEWQRDPIIFDTGQILEGLVRAAVETGSQTYLQAARRAGDWLVEVQDGDGCWRKYTSLGLVHTYNVRVAWALLTLYQATAEDGYRLAAVANLNWAISQQQPDGWFANAGFRLQEDPLTHTIAYTIEGILKSGLLLEDEALIGSARLAADALIECHQADGFIRARYGEGWNSESRWSCLTGNAQIAMIWFLLFQHSGQEKYLDAALAANQALKKIQNRGARLAGLRGGLWGSYPLEEEYEPYRLLNWAAKFFADSLLLESKLANKG